MGATILRDPAFWALVTRQHGVVARRQLLELGFSPKAIKCAVAARRLHPLLAGVYAVGRPGVTREGRWFAALLSCGREAVLSHGSAAALWGIGAYERAEIEVSVPAGTVRRRPGIRAYRRAALHAGHVTRHLGIPITSPIQTLVDLAPRLSRSQAETAVNEADKLGLVSPDTLREALDAMAGKRGTRRLREILDRRTFRLTDSQLERLFLPLARRAGLAAPQTRRRLNGFRVDFYWPELGLVVETDGLRYHRTPAQQARDRLRDQAHTAAGMTPLRFTHEQVRYEAARVEAVLAAVAGRLATAREGSGPA
jgi:very-short-patch-repair endonuclease